MFDFGFENHEPKQRGTRPPTSTIQLVQIQEAEVREGQNGPYINLTCMFVEFNWKSYCNLFFPQNKGDQEKYKKSCNYFMDKLLSFEVPKSVDLRSMTPEKLAMILKGRYAQTNVGENRDGFPEPTWFRRMSTEQSQQYRQPAMPSFGNQSPQRSSGYGARPQNQRRAQRPAPAAKSRYDDEDIPF